MALCAASSNLLVLLRYACPNSPFRCLLGALAGGIVLLSPATGLTQIARSWNTGNGVWSADSNWSPIGVPQSNDSARIGNLPGVENDIVTLDQNDTVAEVQITDGMIFNTAGNTLTVLGDTLVSGSNSVAGQVFRSRLFVDRGAGSDDYDTDNLTVTDEATVELFDGGILEIDEELTIDSESRLFGEGIVRFVIGSGLVTVLRNSGTIQPTAGGMTFNVIGGGDIDLDGADGIADAQVLLDTPNIDGTAFPSLTINARHVTDPFSGEIRMASGALLAMNLEDPWSVGQTGLIRITDGTTGPARITGVDVTIAGRVFITGPDGYLRIVSNATLAPTIDAILREDTRLQFTGDADVEGGMFTIADNSVIEFDGPTTIRGGTFESEVTNPFVSTVQLHGDTVYRGDVTFSGHARQIGDATVAENSVINAEIFSMDGVSPVDPTTWNINATATINADQIQSGIASISRFQGTINVSGPFAAVLRINLSDPNEPWEMAGTMNLTGNTLFSANKYAGSAVNVTGDLNATNIVRFAADAHFEDTSTIGVTTATSVLQMVGNTTVDAGATFVGNGELANIVGGVMSLAAGLSTSQVGVANSGRLRLGEAVGVVSVDRFENGASAMLVADVGRNSIGTDSDVLTTSSGAANLAGFLQPNIVNIGGVFEPPQVGDSFTILTAVGGVNGTFDDVLNSLLGGQVYEWNAIYNPANVVIEVAAIGGLLGDYNNNGVVDAADYSVWLDTFGSMTNLQADGNQNGVIDQADYDLWQANFGDTLGSGAGVAAAPEPLSLALFVTGLLWFGTGRHLLGRWHRCRYESPPHCRTGG